MDITLLGIDVAKSVFELYGVDDKGQKVIEKWLKRSQLTTYIAKLAPCCIVMEACGSANYWARVLGLLGHEVKLIAPQYVKPYVKGNKNDHQDAQAIVEAASRPHMRYVKPKSVEQQDMQSVLRVRSSYIEMRTKLVNQARGLLAEYGIVIPCSVHRLRKTLPALIDPEAENGLSAAMKSLLDRQYTQLLMLDEQIASCDAQLMALAKMHEACQRLQAIEGIGLLSAVVIVALVGNGEGFKNDRHFAAYLGLVPKQHSSGHKERLLGISKRGDSYVRELLIHGGRAVLLHAKKKDDKRSGWVNALQTRRGTCKAAVAIANKNARIAMALLLTGESYRKAA